MGSRDNLKKTIRIPDSLHGELKTQAKKEGRILEQYVWDLIRKGRKVERLSSAD